MQSKFGLVVLGTLATFVLFGGDTAGAVSGTTDKKQEKPAPVIVVVKAGDTLSAIADTQQTSYIRLYNANESITHPDVIDVDDQIRIPAAEEQLPNRLIEATPEVQAAVISAAGNSAQPTAAQVQRGSSAGNTYAQGTCTWYVKQMRPGLPNQLGNGGQWVANAAARGMATGSAPRVGAVAEQPGHVAYVEAVMGSNVTVSEMNYAGGVGQVHRRTVPASNFRYIY